MLAASIAGLALLVDISHAPEKSVCSSATIDCANATLRQHADCAHMIHIGGASHHARHSARPRPSLPVPLDMPSLPLIVGPCRSFPKVHG